MQKTLIQSGCYIDRSLGMAIILILDLLSARKRIATKTWNENAKVLFGRYNH